jgi:hypothetical protein
MESSYLGLHPGHRGGIADAAGVPVKELGMGNRIELQKALTKHKGSWKGGEEGTGDAQHSRRREQPLGAPRLDDLMFVRRSYTRNHAELETKLDQAEADVDAL